jgi:hypothetical protein
MPPGCNWPKRIGRLRLRRHQIGVEFGAPIWPREGEDCNGMMDRVRAYLESREAPGGDGGAPSPALMTAPDVPTPRITRAEVHHQPRRAAHTA